MATMARAFVACGVLIGLATSSRAEDVVQAAAREKVRRGALATVARAYTDDDLEKIAEARRATEGPRQAVESSSSTLESLTDEADALVIGEIDRSTPDVHEMTGSYIPPVHKGEGPVVSISCVDRPSIEDSCLMSYVVITDAAGLSWWTDTPCRHRPSPWPTYNEEERDATRCAVSRRLAERDSAVSTPPSESQRTPRDGVHPWAHSLPRESPSDDSSFDHSAGSGGPTVASWSGEVGSWAQNKESAERGRGDRESTGGASDRGRSSDSSGGRPMGRVSGRQGAPHADAGEERSVGSWSRRVP
jgi:hypothetical protein